LEVNIPLAKLLNVKNFDQAQDFSELPALSPPSETGVSPNNPPWNTPLAIALWVVSVLLILILPNLFVVPYAISQKVQLTDSTKVIEFLLSDPTAVILNIVAIIPAHLITIALAWAIVTKLGKYSFREVLGWKSGGMAWWHYVAILVVFFAIAVLVGYFLPETENDLTRILKSSRTAVYLVAFLATFTAPIVEEVVYRGVVYSALQRTVGVGFAVAAATILFAVVHVPQYYPSYSTILLLTLLSLTLTLIRARTGNLLPCIILHFIFNGLQSLSLLLAPDLPQTLPDPQQVASMILHIL
jgi:membrane protease YdiL (CAAX protease family)